MVVVAENTLANHSITHFDAGKLAVSNNCLLIIDFKKMVVMSKQGSLQA